MIYDQYTKTTCTESMSGVFLIFIFSICLCTTSAEFYSAVSSMRHLLDVEAIIVQQIDELLIKMQQTQDSIESFVNYVTDIQDEIGDVEEYSSNPINAISIIHRMAVQWKEWVFDPINSKDEFQAYTDSFLGHFENLNLESPTSQDLIGASLGLWRLQETYKLPTKQLADGFLLHDHTNISLSASDCYHIGSNFNELKKYPQAVEWLIQAHARNTNANIFPSIQEPRILEQLTLALQHVGNYKLANKLNNKLLRLEPDNVSATANKLFLETQLVHQRSEKLKEKLQLPAKEETDSLQELFEGICRGEVRQSPQQQRDLRCRYTDRNVPFRRLAPFKVEELNLDPKVDFYHDVLHDKEIEKIMSYGSGKNFKRSLTGEIENRTASEVRVCKNTWLWYENHPWLASIRQRLEDITGLSTETAEPLQLANYGIGGHFHPHCDYLLDPKTVFGWKGDRILTAMFYMNDVTLGGSTAFMELKLAVQPVKGSALVWYNMNDSLEQDARTKHAGCPVLKGSKWITNEWFHVGGQEFKRPCGLKHVKINRPQCNKN